VRLARLTSSPFTDRLVAKFDLSIHGWRGAARREQAASTAVSAAGDGARHAD
jgi:NAD+ kinase